MIRIIGQVWEQSLINVKNPGIHAIISELKRPSIGQGHGGNNLKIESVTLTSDIVLDIGSTILRYWFPGGELVSLSGKPPALAPHDQVFFLGIHGGELEDEGARQMRIGGGGAACWGDGDAQQEDRKKDEGLHWEREVFDGIPKRKK